MAVPNVEHTKITNSNGMTIYTHYTDLKKGYYFAHFADSYCKVCEEEKKDG